MHNICMYMFFRCTNNTKLLSFLLKEKERKKERNAVVHMYNIYGMGECGVLYKGRYTAEVAWVR
jgi:hypothetical protein